MNEVPWPSFDFLTTYDAVVSDVTDLVVAGSMKASRSNAENSGQTYLGAGVFDILHGLTHSDFLIDGLTKEQVTALYTSYVVGSTATARTYYDEIRLSADWCPYCGDGEVAEVDHYLPKTRFHSLFAAPLNLLPICIRCNRKKSTTVGTSSDERFLHPYFDTLSNRRLIEAEVDVSGPRFRFYPHGDLDTTWHGRVEFHLTKLRLKAFFAKKAARAVVQAKRQLTSIHAGSGATGVMDEALTRANSVAIEGLNTWEYAAWSACAESVWFCDGGFLEFGK